MSKKQILIDFDLYEKERNDFKNKISRLERTLFRHEKILYAINKTELNLIEYTIGHGYDEDTQRIVLF